MTIGYFANDFVLNKVSHRLVPIRKLVLGWRGVDNGSRPGTYEKGNTKETATNKRLRGLVGLRAAHAACVLTLSIT